MVKSSFLELLLKYWLQEADKSFVGLFVSRSCSAMSSMSGDRDSAKSGVRNGRTRASDAGQRREREGALCNRWGKSRACRRRFSALEEMSSDIQFIHSSRTAMGKQRRRLKWGRCPQLCIVPRYRVERLPCLDSDGSQRAASFSRIDRWQYPRPSVPSDAPTAFLPASPLKTDPPLIVQISGNLPAFFSGVQRAYRSVKSCSCCLGHSSGIGFGAGDEETLMGHQIFIFCCMQALCMVFMEERSARRLCRV